MMTEHYKNKSLDNIVELIDGVLYTEEWKDIEGYEGLYMISTFGRIKSIGTYNNKKPSICSQRAPKNGYLLCSVWKNNKERKILVHRLVGMAFIDNPFNKKTINHKKGIKFDNRMWSLEWTTQSENAKHSFRELNRKPWQAGKKGKDCIFSKPVNKYSMSGDFLERYDSVTIAAYHNNTSARNISHNLTGDQKTAGGYKWEYA